MGTGNWILDNLYSALQFWNAKLAEIWMLITQSPQSFKGGGIWDVVTGINGALKAIGYALLVLFFLVGVVKTCGSFAEIKKPEHALKLFVRFAIAKGVISYGLDLMMALFKIVQGIVTTIIGSGGLDAAQAVTLPDGMITAVENLTFLESIPAWAVSLIMCLVVFVLTLVMVMSVYGRFFRLYLYTAIAPVPLSTFAGEPSSHIGKSFLKSYAAVCLEGAIIVLACIIFSVSIVWAYMGELIFNLLVLTGAVKMSERVVREMFGL